MKNIAFIDFDGTLSSGYISMEFLDAVYKKGLYDKKQYKLQMDMLKQLNEGSLGYDEWCQKWGEVWAEGLKGVKADAVEKEAFDFFNKFKSKIHESSYTLISLLKKEGFHTTIVSVGASEVIDLAAKELKVDTCYATRLEVDDVYTGNILTKQHVPGGKIETVESLLGSGKYLRSVAIGDSVGDIGMLEKAEIAIALNASDGLKKEAEKRGWNVFTYKNVFEGVKELLGSKQNF